LRLQLESQNLSSKAMDQPRPSALSTILASQKHSLKARLANQT